MTETMAAYRVVEWQHPPELVEIPVPTVGPGQVLVEVAGCGLCHSDLTMTEMPAEIGDALGWQVPFTLGHESAGRVVEVGAGVTTVAVGDPVALTSPSSCGTCAHCRAGRDSACAHGDTGRGYGRDGGLARYVRADSVRDVLPLGALDPRHAGPLTDAGATTHHAVRRARSELGPGSVAVVIGVGGLGSFAVQILRATTEAHIVAVETDPARREVALALGADEAIEALRRGEGPTEVDAVIDIVGVDDTIRRGLGALRRGGAFVLVGAAGGGFPRPWMGGLPREVTVTSIQGSSIADAQAVIDLAAAGAVTLAVDEFPLTDVATAYQALDAGSPHRPRRRHPLNAELGAECTVSAVRHMVPGTPRRHTGRMTVAEPSLPVGLALEDWTGDARFHEYTRAANPVGRTTPLIPVEQFPASLHRDAATGVVPLDLSGPLGIADGPATSPALLASFATVRAGEALVTEPRATSELYVVMRGAGTTELTGEVDGGAVPGPRAMCSSSPAAAARSTGPPPMPPSTGSPTSPCSAISAWRPPSVVSARPFGPRPATPKSWPRSPPTRPPSAATGSASC